MVAAQKYYSNKYNVPAEEHYWQCLEQNLLDNSPHIMINILAHIDYD